LRLVLFPLDSEAGSWMQALADSHASPNRPKATRKRFRYRCIRPHFRRDCRKAWPGERKI